MTARSREILFTTIRCLTALVVIVQSALFLGHTHNAIERTVGIAELIAALLFIVPRTLRIGAAGLLFIFILVMVVHRDHNAVWLIYPAMLVVLIASMPQGTYE